MPSGHKPHRRGLARATLCLLAACFPALFAQDLRYLRHQSWSTEDGLPQDSVHRVYQAADGFLWVATEGGIARFDGLSFKIFNHANEPAFTSDDTCCLAGGPDGGLWVGTADGLLRLGNGHWGRFGVKAGLPSGAIKTLITKPDGSLLVQTADGAALLDGNRFELSSDPSPFTQIVEGTGTAGWSSTNTTVTRAANNKVREWKIGSTLPGSRVQTLFVDRRGTAWVGTNDGLVALRKDTPEVVAIPALRGVSILQIFEDREGNYWVGGETSGLHVLRPLPFRTEPALADKPLTALVQATDGAVWIGTRRDGLRRLRHGTVDEPAKPAALTSPVILSLAPGTRGSLWAGTPDGLNHIQPNGTVRRTTSADGLPDDYIQALQTARDGSLWAGTRHGLVHLQSGKVQVLTKADGLGGDLIGALLLTTRNELWVATSGGLSRRDPMGKITTFRTKDGLPEGVVSAMAEDPTGALWIAGRPGTLTRFANGLFRQIPLENSTPATGLAADAQGQLWLRGERGIGRIALQALNACAGATQQCSPDITRYGLADGLPSEETAPGGSPLLWPMANGELWFATRRGVAIVDAAHPGATPAPPPVVLERFLVDDSPVATGQAPLRLPYARSRYTFEYAGLSYTAPSDVRYRFRLEGFDAAWTDAGSRRSATYTNLPPGTFRFRVQANLGDGAWSEAGAELPFRIIPPFYRRWWFYLITAFSLAAVAIALYRLRLRRLEGRFHAVLKERNRLAREIHDTLAQDFVGVSLQLDLIAQFLSLSKVDAALNQVRQTRKLVTDGLAEARRSIWELRANLAQDSLPSRLGQIVERYSGDSPKVHLKIGGAYRSLDPRVEAEFLRVAQEALSNVQRHADATEANVELRYKSDMLMLTVEDNGRGFAIEQAPVNGHYGLRGMRERAAVVGGTLTVASSPETGTTITLSASIAGAEEQA